jgi:hypothetical protein
MEVSQADDWTRQSPDLADDVQHKPYDPDNKIEGALDRG